MLMCRCCGCCGEHKTALLLQRKIKRRGIVQEKHLSHSNKRSAGQAATISLWVYKKPKSRYIICFHNGFALLDEVCVMFSVILPLCQPPPSFSWSLGRRSLLPLKQHGALRHAFLSTKQCPVCVAVPENRCIKYLDAYLHACTHAGEETHVKGQ